MKRFLKHLQAHAPRVAASVVAALAGFAAAAVIGVALARTLALQVAHDATVTNQADVTKIENIVVSRGFAAYRLTGDSPRHPECTKANGCFSVWPPITVRSPKNVTKAAGIKGMLGTWHRDGFFQLTLGGHPLYRFALDRQKGHATGEGIHSFGGTWHAVEAARRQDSTTTGTTGTTTPTMCVYPPYC